MPIQSFDQTLYCWDRVNKTVVTLENDFNSTYYNGNFKGAWKMPVTESSERILKGSGVTKYDVTQHIKNDGTYIRFNIKGSGMTTSLVTGNIKLYFEEGWSGTVLEAVSAGKIDPIVFRYTSMSSTAHVWDTSDLFTGGRTDGRNYPYVYIYLKPLLPNVLTHFEFYTNKTLNTTYDGLVISQTNITLIGTAADEIFYLPEGHFISAPIDASVLPENVRLKWTSDILDGTSIAVNYTLSENQLNHEEWIEVNNGDTINITGNYLWVKCILQTSDSSATPVLTRLWLEEPDAPDDQIRLVMHPQSRFNNVEGDLTIDYDASKGNLLGRGGAVESFSYDFIPVNLETKPNPHAAEIITITPYADIAFTRVYYRQRYDSEKLTATANATVVFTYVGTVNP